MKTQQRRAWSCRCGNGIINITMDYPEGQQVDAQIELGLVVCGKCRRVPTLTELVTDRQPKGPSKIIIPGRSH